MILARFNDAAARDSTADRLTEAGVTTFETFGTTPPPDARRSLVPLLMIAFGLATALGAFAMQAYATTYGYRFNIGGRPDLFWPSYIPFALEIGFLVAILTGVVGFLIAAQMPSLYDPVDDGFSFPSTSQDGWFLSVPGKHATASTRAMLTHAALVEDLPE